MISQLDVEHFAEVPGVGPQQGWELRLFPIALSDILRGRENP